MDALTQKMYEVIKSGLINWQKAALSRPVECPYTGEVLSADNATFEYLHGYGFDELAGRFKADHRIRDATRFTLDLRKKWVGFFFELVKMRLILIEGDIAPEGERIRATVVCFDKNGQVWELT